MYIYIYIYIYIRPRSVPGAIEDDHDQGHAASRDVRGLDEAAGGA